jgi:hypothetical protein
MKKTICFLSIGLIFTVLQVTTVAAQDCKAGTHAVAKGEIYYPCAPDLPKGWNSNNGGGQAFDDGLMGTPASGNTGMPSGYAVPPTGGNTGMPSGYAVPPTGGNTGSAKHDCKNNWTHDKCYGK